MKKTPNKISTEDLLAALENNDELKSVEVQETFDYKNDIPLFLSKFNIEAGSNTISKSVLYRLYHQYSKFPVSPQEFTATTGLFLNIISQRCFGINKPKAEIMQLVTVKQQASGRYKPSSLTTRKHFERFMEENNVKNGNKWIEAGVLLYIYTKWCRETRKSIRFKLPSFTTVAKLFLESKRTTHINSWFKVHESILEKLTDEDRRKINDAKLERKEKYKKTNKK